MYGLHLLKTTNCCGVGTFFEELRDLIRTSEKYQGNANQSRSAGMDTGKTPVRNQMLFLFITYSPTIDITSIQVVFSKWYLRETTFVIPDQSLSRVLISERDWFAFPWYLLEVRIKSLSSSKNVSHPHSNLLFSVGEGHTHVSNVRGGTI